MNSSTDSETPSPAETLDTGRIGETPPANWREALFALIESRVELIRLESRDAVGHGVRRLVMILAAVVCAFFTWVLLLAGVIGAISNLSGWHWFWVAIATGAVHLLAAIMLANMAKAPGRPPFPVTRSEFKKDREWIENLKKSPKSSA